MTSSDRLIKKAQPLLPPGTHVQCAFMGQKAPNTLIFIINYLTYLTHFWITYRVVCIADDAIYVFRATKFSITPTDLIATLSRDVRFGLVTGTWAKIDLMGDNYWVHKRFHEGINAVESNRVKPK